jgi:PAS domain S-box-containing protein
MDVTADNVANQDDVQREGHPLDAGRILVVDDDANLRRTVSDILQAKGYETEAAATGREALVGLSADPPAVALIDLRMEGLPGLEVLDRIRELSPETECIVLTGHASRTSAIEAVNLGAYGYLQKPYEIDQLLVTIQRAVERRQDRRALRESEEKYRGFFETSRDCTFITSRQGRWLEMNQAAIQLFGYPTKAALRAVNVRNLYADPADRAALTRTIEQRGAVKDYPVNLRHKNGDVIHALISAVVHVNAQNEVVGYQGTVRDITERTRAEQALANYAVQLADQNDELERVNEQKNRFLGIAAHELRSPLQFILAYSEFLVGEASDTLTDRQMQFLSIIRSSSEYVVRLVNDLLDVAKIEAGKLELNPEPTDLGALVRENVSLNRTLAAKKDVGIRLEVETLAPLVVDPDKMVQVLNNLINNAVKYSPPGSTVDVRLHPDGQYVHVSVRDRGPGIPEDALDRVFQPFETTKTKAPDGQKGTGLGLAIAKKIVEGHGGSIWVQSEPGQGATFHVTLPFGGPDLGEAP